MKTKLIGIYKITNPKGKVYIGQSTDIAKRFRYYRNLHCFSQKKLFNSLKKYGHINHQFEILEECNAAELNDKEIYYINKFKSFNNANGLNLQSGGYNGKHSDETKLKMSISKKGRVVSEETREKLRQANLGKTISPEYRKKLSDANKGKIFSDEQRLKMSLSAKKRGSNRKGVKLTEEHKAKLSLANKGKRRQG